ncbi:MAG: FISUMP domain-containing protein [Bacteroidota bacterium]
MGKLLSFRIFLLSLIAMVILVPACRKDNSIWKPDALLIIEPDSGLTTQTFDLRIDMLNLPATQSEFYIRWDMNGDSVWDDVFTAYPTISHRFYQTGIHLVKAEILTEDGQCFTLQRNIRIDQGYSAPHASFSVDPPESHYLTEFTFDASTTFDDEDPFSSLIFRWDFESDGIWDTEASSSPVAKHRFKKSDDYAVKLGVTDPTQRIGDETKILAVTLHDDLINPDFTWSPPEATVKDTFLLDASSTRHQTDSTRIYSYSWNIRSEISYGPFTDPVFSHVFWSAGMQEVTLLVTDQHGLSNSCTKEFFVIRENKPPTPAIQTATLYGNIATNFYFSAWPSRDDVTATSRLLIRWDFEGDGTWDTGWSYEKELFHQFGEPGTFNVTLQAEDEGGERGIGNLTIQVSQYTVPTGFIQDRRDDKYYGTVKIGNQWWMSDNLDFRISPKLVITLLQNCYSESRKMCDLYGALYQGKRTVSYIAAGKNICPDGWRVPLKKDWEELYAQVPRTGGRDALMVGGSMGFNAKFTGSGTYVFVYDDFGNLVDTAYTFKGFGEEVKFLSLTLRPSVYPLRSQTVFWVQKHYDGADVWWDDLEGFYYVRCIKED